MSTDPEMAPDPQDQLSNTQQAPQESDEQRWKRFTARITACKTFRRKLISLWVTSIDYRRGKPFSSQTDEDRVVVNLDWSNTKTKHAALFSQMPAIHVNHPPQTVQAGPWLQSYEQRLNDTLRVGGLEAAMDEILPDVINAAGIGAVIVSHEALTEQVQVPSVDFAAMDPQQAQMIQQSGMMPDGTPIPMQVVPRISDHRYCVSRVSPADILWPLSFTGTNFDNAPWIGRSGRMPWQEAKVRFGLRDEERESLAGEDRNSLDRLTHDVDKDKVTADEEVGFDEIFYKEYQFTPGAKSYSAIHHLVFLAGRDKPVVDEPWKGQQLTPEGVLYGAVKYPLRVLTLTYISDDAIPPSDSAVSRPQIKELNKSRTQMILQRERSIPIRWFNPNLVDPLIQQALMRGTMQAMIPINGDGQRAIGETARASYPPEDFTIDTIVKNDINELLGIGPNQAGNFGKGRQSAAESKIVDASFNTRIGRERAKVEQFILGVAEVIGGLLSIFESPESFGQGFDPAISRALEYSMMQDSTVLLDSNIRIKRLIDFFNFSAKTGWVDLPMILKEIAQLSSIDPTCIRPPEPSKPEPPNISLRLTGMEDLLNPLALATLINSGQAPNPKQIEDAKKLIQLAVVPPLAPEPGPGGAPGAPVPPQEVQPPPPMPPNVGDAHPNLTEMPKVNKRADQEN